MGFIISQRNHIDCAALINSISCELPLPRIIPLTCNPTFISLVFDKRLYHCIWLNLNTSFAACIAFSNPSTTGKNTNSKTFHTSSAQNRSFDSSAAIFCFFCRSRIFNSFMKSSSSSMLLPLAALMQVASARSMKHTQNALLYM